MRSIHESKKFRIGGHTLDEVEYASDHVVAARCLPTGQNYGHFQWFARDGTHVRCLC
jgi:hypothetical protein